MYSFLEGFLSAAKPTTLINAKEWILNNDSNDNNNHKDNDNDNNFDDNNDLMQKKHRKKNPNYEKQNNRNNDNNDSNNNNNKTKEKDNLKKSVDIPPSISVGKLSDKYAHAVIFKIIEFEWRAQLLIQELDKSRSFGRMKGSKVR